MTIKGDALKKRTTSDIYRASWENTFNRAVLYTVFKVEKLDNNKATYIPVGPTKFSKSPASIYTLTESGIRHYDGGELDTDSGHVFEKIDSLIPIIGYPVMFNNDDVGYIITSPVDSYETFDDKVVLTTLNSIYECFIHTEDTI